MSTEPAFSIDVFSLFGGQIRLTGWLFDHRPIRSLALRRAGIEGGEWPLLSYGALPSPDVAKVHGAIAERVRFDECWALLPDFSLSNCVLAVCYADGDIKVISDLGAPRNQRAPMLQMIFREKLKEKATGSLIEIGSRARSGVTRRDFLPEDWQYTGLDIVAGPNVDLVGDAHQLSSLFPEKRFDAVMAFSVLEHLLMPWKMVIELNAILNVGAVGLFTTHQCWPIHDAPWDFWRFSDRAWDGLLNSSTGFEIIESSMGEPAFIVAQRCHRVTNFGEQQAGWLASNVLFRKTGPTRLRWDVSVADVLQSSYPPGEVATP